MNSENSTSSQSPLFFKFLTDSQALLIDELDSCLTAEERLEFLISRERLTTRLTPSECTDSIKVPGCLSGLWVLATSSDRRFYFRSASDSAVVDGIASFICDLCSGHNSESLNHLGADVQKRLGLDSLLSLNRRAAVAKIFAYIHSRCELPQ